MSVRPLQVDRSIAWTGGSAASSTETASARLATAGAAGLGSWAAAGIAIAPRKSQANRPTASIASADEIRPILHLPLGQAAVAELCGGTEPTMAWRETTHSNDDASFIGLAGATTSGRHNSSLRGQWPARRSQARRIHHGSRRGASYSPFCNAVVGVGVGTVHAWVAVAWGRCRAALHVN